MNNQKIKMIDKKLDAIIFLNQLIVLAHKRMRRYKEAINDLENEVSMLKPVIRSIKTEIYEMHQDRLMGASTYLLNLYGDETKLAASYKQFRNLLDKKLKLGKEEFELPKLEGEIVQLLNQFRDVRNWSLHIPQSLLTSQIDFIKNEQKISEGLIEFMFSRKEINVSIWEYHERAYFEELLSTHNELYIDFLKVFQRMQEDYSYLIGTKSTIVESKELESRPNQFSNIAQKSFEINTQKRGR